MSYDGFSVCPRNITERNMALYINKNQLCLIWKSNAIKCKKAVKELNLEFKSVDNVITDKHPKSFIEYEQKTKKFQSQLTNIIVYDIETFNTNKAFTSAIGIKRLSKISGKHHRDTTDREFENCEKGCIVFKGTDSNNEMLDYVLQLKGKLKKLKTKLLNIFLTN